MVEPAIAGGGASSRARAIEAEVIDLRTLRPLDTDTIAASAARTGRLVVVEEGPPMGGYAADVVALAVELAGPIRAKRVSMPDIPIPVQRAARGLGPAVGRQGRRRGSRARGRVATRRACACDLRREFTQIGEGARGFRGRSTKR